MSPGSSPVRSTFIPSCSSLVPLGSCCWSESPLAQDQVGACSGAMPGKAGLADSRGTVADRSFDREPHRTVCLMGVVRRLERGPARRATGGRRRRRRLLVVAGDGGVDGVGGDAREGAGGREPQVAVGEWVGDRLEIPDRILELDAIGGVLGGA